VDTRTDVLNCGGCGIACGYPNAGALCQDGQCALGPCAEFFGNCDASPLNGCEVDLLGDEAHCGSCGNACSLPNAVADCTGATCVVNACTPGWGDCDGAAASGCETALGTVDHCGSCLDSCAFPHASSGCTGGACVLEGCASGYGDCDADPQNGCEEPLTSTSHCGACGNACPAGQTCVGGGCTAGCPDADGDGHAANGCGGDDCRDDDAGVNPGAPEVCGDGIDQDCSGADLPCGCEDLDGDGHGAEGCGGDDCDDGNAGVHPQATEVCGDGTDQDCNGSDLACGCQDADGDDALDSGCGGDDCNDSDPGIHPGAAEICHDSIDQDCDGEDASCPRPDPGCGCGPGAGGAWSLLLMPAFALRRRRR
jgi:uncharacterized protein (TIGR03382 family)